MSAKSNAAEGRQEGEPMKEVTITPEESAMLLGSGEKDGAATTDAPTESEIEKLQKENAALKRQLERQRSDLLILTKAAMNGMAIVHSNLKLIEVYSWDGIDGEDARQGIHGMLAFEEEAD